MPSEIERSSLSITSSFGPGLKAVREALSLTQAATARSASITKNCLNMLERGTGTIVANGSWPTAAGELASESAATATSQP